MTAHVEWFAASDPIELCPRGWQVGEHAVTLDFAFVGGFDNHFAIEGSYEDLCVMVKKMAVALERAASAPPSPPPGPQSPLAGDGPGA